ncbi:MAG: autotransporter outer membrane beta-barrel domain-containing protein, partial [Comamonadaceae bacterium]
PTPTPTPTPTPEPPPPAPQPPAPEPPAPPPPAPQPPRVPNYRQEVSLYSAVPSLAVLHSAATTHSWHERIGGAGAAAGLGDQPSRLWLRVVGQSGKRSGDALGIHGSSGPSYEHKTTGLQLGGDLLRERHANSSQSAAGVFVATGRTTGDVRHFNGQLAGTATLDVHSVGGYWTWMGAQGAYVDVLAQGNRYSVKAASTRMAALKSSGSGYELSVEGGLPYRLGSTAWRIEPQLQVRMLSADLDGGHDAAGRVQFGDAESLVGRAGLRLSYQTDKLTGWTRLDLLNEFKGRSRTTLSTLAGAHAVDFSTSVHGRSLVLTAGIDAKLSQSTSLYGAASYRRAMGDSRGSAWTWQAGVKVAW